MQQLSITVCQLWYDLCHSGKHTHTQLLGYTILLAQPAEQITVL